MSPVARHASTFVAFNHFVEMFAMNQKIRVFLSFNQHGDLELVWLFFFQMMAQPPETSREYQRSGKGFEFFFNFCGEKGGNLGVFVTQRIPKRLESATLYLSKKVSN